MEHFVIIVNAWKRLTIITKSSILGIAAVLDPVNYSIYDGVFCENSKQLFDSVLSLRPPPNPALSFRNSPTEFLYLW